jgi:hypothetical protein
MYQSFTYVQNRFLHFSVSKAIFRKPNVTSDEIFTEGFGINKINSENVMIYFRHLGLVILPYKLKTLYVNKYTPSRFIKYC